MRYHGKKYGWNHGLEPDVDTLNVNPMERELTQVELCLPSLSLTLHMVIHNSHSNTNAHFTAGETRSSERLSDLVA